jgi:Ca2+-transporting ATPase
MTTVHEQRQPSHFEAYEGLLRKLFFEDGHRYFSFTKGSVERLLEVCDRVWAHGQVHTLDETWRERIDQAEDQMALEGLRVLGFAYRPLNHPPEGELSEHLEQGLIFVGLVGMVDPPRPEVKEAVLMCKKAGIRPAMITGDHPLTAKRIAQELKIASQGDDVLTGQDLSQMSAGELEDVVEKISVYARVSPEHKLEIVQALQNKGHIVAMTGDGVNDAPALRKSDIGVAMGITGTDVAKEAGDMVITDDNFATIVNAVREGRTIFDNVRKFIRYTMTSNAGEILVMLLAPFLGMPLPLTALQILWVNLVTDGLPGLALGVEPAEKGTMERPPSSPSAAILNREMGRQILWVGLLMAVVSLGVGFWGWQTGRPTWQTMIFTTLTLSQMGNAFAIRSKRESLFRLGLLTNKPMLGAVLLTVCLQAAVTYWQPLQTLFGTLALSPVELLISLGLSTVVFWASEVEKWWVRRGMG